VGGTPLNQLLCRIADSATGDDILKERLSAI
jgi:hypothetical protein